MKFTVDVDCTPEEARRFLGLPDLSPVHEAYVEKIVSEPRQLEHADRFTRQTAQCLFFRHRPVFHRGRSVIL